MSLKLLHPRTLTFLLKGTEILLGLKMQGFGKDYLLGIGGKVENGETIEEAAKREVAEEISVLLPELRKVGVLNFFFPHIADGSWDLQIHVYTATKWEGEPQESEEIKPSWFPREEIPYERMWDDARYWLPHILSGECLEGEFVYNQELKVAHYTLTPLLTMENTW
jgi:8-oxo-dGTP pyrophosphatase MutT (NUDIX family)